MSGSAPGPPGGAGATARETTWETLRRRSRVYPPEPPGRPGVCAVCRGPAGPGYTRCYQCARHEVLGPDLLADAVVPISYAVKGTAFAADLWRYKAGGGPWTEPAAARTSLLALLLAAPYLRLPQARLVIRPGRQGRDPDPSRFHTERGRLRAEVLLLEDSWVSGSSAQSAAAALKRAGAKRVAVIVLGRHLDPADRFGASLAARVAELPYDPGRCAVHSVPRTRE